MVIAPWMWNLPVSLGFANSVQLCRPNSVTRLCLQLENDFDSGMDLDDDNDRGCVTHPRAYWLSRLNFGK
jgi:hypothetical protein